MIARIYNWLFHACQHQWEEFERREVLQSWGEKKRIGENVYLRCKKCGDVVRRELY